MEKRMLKLYSKSGTVPLKVVKGHFATNHSHINYYIDITTLKTRLSEAESAAKELVNHYLSSAVVDTIVCLDGTEVIGTCLASELTHSGFMSLNSHRTIYVVTPEYNSNSQLLFRDNIQPMIEGKHVLILMASVTTGKTISKSIECVQYYGGTVEGLGAACLKWASSGVYRHHKPRRRPACALGLHARRPARLCQLRRARMPLLQGGAAHRGTGEQLRLFQAVTGPGPASARRRIFFGVRRPFYIVLLFPFPSKRNPAQGLFFS